MYDVEGTPVQSIVRADADLSGDADDDGMPDGDELYAGLNPHSGLSVFSVEGGTLHSLGPDQLIISSPSASGRTYSLLRTESLEQPFSFVATGVAATTPVNSCTDQDRRLRPCRFSMSVALSRSVDSRLFERNDEAERTTVTRTPYGGNMNLVRLVYVSRLSRDCGMDELGKIMTVSRRNNKHLGVTGGLCYSSKGFLQILEGPAPVVNELYRRIVQDKRHVDVTLVEYRQIPYRDFANWSMAYIRADEVDSAILRKFSTSRFFDPFQMSPEQARQFMIEVTAERAEFLARQQASLKRK